MSRRVMGKASFAHLQDGKGLMQIYVRRDDIGSENYKLFKSYDLGDILGVEGMCLKPKQKKYSACNKNSALTKCLKPLPEKFHGLQDMDLRYRQRYLDMIVNPKLRIHSLSAAK